MDIRSIFEQMLVLLILLVLGVIAAKTGVVDAETNRRMSRFALIFPQSAQILSSAMTVGAGMSIGQLLAVEGEAVLVYAIFVVLGFLAPLALRVEKTDRGIYSFMTIFGNCGYMGLPVVRSIFGDQGVLYAALVLIPFNLLAYSYGIALLRKDRTGAGFHWRTMVNPPVIAALAAAVIVALDIRFPSPVVRATGLMGDMIVPMSMVIIGASLGGMKLKEVFADWHTYAFVPVRLILCPVVVWAVLRLFVHDGLVLGVMTVEAAMPVATFSTMLSIQYGGNVSVASRTVFVSTVLSVVTIPFVCWLLPM